MLKKRVLKRLLPLLFSFCCVFSGFLNVDASASTIVIDETESYSFTARSYFGIYSGAYMNDVGISTGSGSRIYNKSDVTATSDSYYSLDNNQLKNVSYLNVTFRAGESYPIISELYDYYLYFYWSFDDICTFNPDKFIVTYNDGTTNILHSFEPFTVLPYNMDGKTGFGCYSKVDFSTDMAVNSICVGDSRMNATVGADAHFWALIIPIEKGSSQEQINSIISAINNQTTTLDGSIGQAADDIQQSIEDQFSGDPEEEFSVDDVIMQHNEKMGVLSFGSDVMLQFLDMFQSANVGTAELTLPGFNITVENVEYSVWPDYSFNFEQLNEWVPALMSVIRVMLPAFVWLMVLRYCIKVFEDNFLAK